MDVINKSDSFEKIVGPIRLPLEVDNIVDYYYLYYFEYKEQRWASVIYGNIESDNYIPLRIESACFFGHVFHSRQCDCGFQLTEAFSRIRKEKVGVVIYGIDQDARGLGIYNHFRIYDLRQNNNLDTQQVFDILSSNIDERSYDAVAEILKFLKIKNVKLLSNNPSRINFLKNNGFNVKREELEASLDKFNMATLMLEKEDLGYKWSFETHAHWLTPIQKMVENNMSMYGGRIVSDNREIIAEWVGNKWDLARNLQSQIEKKIEQIQTLIVYLTDLPRIDEIKIYFSMNVRFIVLPFTEFPEQLQSEAKKYDIKLQDWARENKYSNQRPQWKLKAYEGKKHVYEREEEIVKIEVMS